MFRCTHATGVQPRSVCPAGFIAPCTRRCCSSRGPPHALRIASVQTVYGRCPAFICLLMSYELCCNAKFPVHADPGRARTVRPCHTHVVRRCMRCCSPTCVPAGTDGRIPHTACAHVHAVGTRGGGKHQDCPRITLLTNPLLCCLGLLSYLGCHGSPGEMPTYLPTYLPVCHQQTSSRYLFACPNLWNLCGPCVYLPICKEFDAAVLGNLLAACTRVVCHAWVGICATNELPRPRPHGRRVWLLLGNRRLPSSSL